jgi:hypothetical protein
MDYFFDKLEIPHPKFNVVAYAMPCDIPIRGNVIATDDAESDRAFEDELIARAEWSWRAWFDVKVTARFRYNGGDFIEVSHWLGGNSYADGDEDALAQVVADHSLVAEVVAMLETRLITLKDALSRLDLGPKPVEDEPIGPMEGRGFYDD